MEIKILRITVVRLYCRPDRVYLHTNLPEPTYPFNPTCAILTFDVVRGNTEKYCSEHFPGVPVSWAGDET